MNYSPELTRALETLRQITGITMQVKAETPEEEELALTQIRCICSAYQEKYSRTHFLQGAITGTLSSYEILERAPHFHISVEEPRVLFLIKGKNGLDESAQEVLKNLLPIRPKAFLVPLAEDCIALLRSVKASEPEHTVRRTAHAIIDTLNTEALTSAQVAYSGTFEALTDCQAAYKSAYLALKVGSLFYAEQRVFPYNELGIGCLIYQLPPDVCVSFLHELFGSDIPVSLDEETNAVANRFLQNNLNIAETSRQLHMHRNTLIYRLDQIQKRIGLDLRVFEDAMTFKIASMVMNYLQTERNSKHE